MSVNKKNRSLWGSRSEAQRIYYQRQTIKRLEKENNQLKLDFELYKDNHIYKNYEVERKDIVIKELRNWLEEEINKGGSSIDLAIRIHTLQEVLNRLEYNND